MAQIIVQGTHIDKRVKNICFYVSILFKEGESHTTSAKYNVENLRAELEEVIQRYELNLVNTYSSQNNDLFEADNLK